MHLLFRHSTRAIGALAALLIVAAAAYWPGLHGGFIFDDYPIFAENPVVHVTSWHLEAWQALWMWTHINVQRPIAMFSYALNYAFGASTWGFKATNLCIHLLNVVLVWLFVRNLLKACWHGEAAKSTDNTPYDFLALVAASAWAIHPLQVSAVMYVVQRMELLGLTFTLIALLLYWRARQRQLRGERAWPQLLACAAVIVIGYGAKETLVLVPGYAFLMELTVLRFGASRPAIQKAWKVGYAAIFIAAFAIILGYLIPHFASQASYAGRSFTPWERELTQLRVLCMYIKWAFLPLPDQLHFYYDNYPYSTGLLHPFSTLICAVILVMLLALAVAVRHRRPLMAFGIGWFFVANALTSAPMALELVFEHRNYPALLGIVLAVTDLLWVLGLRIRSRLPLIIALVMILNLSFLTMVRAATWGDSFNLALTLTQTNPGSPRAALDLARRYVSMSGDDPQMPLYWLGVSELKRAALLPDSSILAEEALLIQAANHPGLDPETWWNSLLQKLRTQPATTENYLALDNLQRQQLGASPGIDAHKLAQAYEIAIARNPGRPSLHVQYAELASRSLHNPELAVAQWQKAIALQKITSVYVQQVAGYLIENHRGEEALAVIAEAQVVQPAMAGDSAILSLEAKAKALAAPGG
jgi:protein O-mannosyl-transferase